MSDRQRHGLVLLLVLGLIAASAVAVLTQKTFLGLDLKGGTELIYKGQPTSQTPKVTPAALQRAVNIMDERVNQLGVTQPNISTAQGNIDVQLPDVQDTARAEAEVGTTAQLYFYDWEANVLLPTGKPAASKLLVQDPTAVTISRGGGAPGAGSMTLYDAVKLAAKQPASKGSSQPQPQYYLFGKGGTPVCAAAAKFYGVIEAAANGHCLVSGPDDNQNDLKSGLPPGVTSLSQGQMLVIRPGTVVLQAVPANFSHPPKPAAPNTQFYVLHDDAALNGNEISNPQQSTDASGSPDVNFGFSGKGASAFTNVTAQIARRGSEVSVGSTQLQQHFAVALDNVLITVPQIDYTTYPAGIPSDQGAEITGGFTISSAQDLANELRDGALPIGLKLIATQQISASLGKQALHQGLIAGIAGLLVVALFLLLYYRVLGLIAVGGLVAYGLYFFALIKLIPITLTLAGIAGLILTIGVAADANIVIFERVKEEIRAGRNIRQGIAIGYRKGLTAIVDANVVTIMTAFILFVLATQDVKGFAFTLGIGVIVSLFTAVLATQAILMTLGDSRAIQHRSALGAGGEKRVWRMDFMGASKYFFSLSGTILLIGALAIGGKGLNLGIDFTSGSQITVALDHPATVGQLQTIIGGSPTVVAIKNKAVGGNAFQINAKELQPQQINNVKSTLESRYGVRSFNQNSIGPTFGSTVANSAVIAIIASLAVISLYIAIRFEWKFAVPVLIALMHDLLITSGVYALTGRTVTADTVAALLTILGYSLYDTIIVFDRVRENIPRMPRAAFSQILNRSMSEVLTRSLATTSCTLLPVIALLIFGGSTLKDFAFALMIGVASGAYSSIFIASPVLMHWKEREPSYRARRSRLTAELGAVPAYAGAGADVDPEQKRARRTGRLTAPEPDSVSAAEFEQMKRDLEIEQGQPSRRASTLTKRLAHTGDGDDGAPTGERARPATDRPRPAAPSRGKRAGQARRAAPKPAAPPVAPPAPPLAAEPEEQPSLDEQRPVTPAPDIAENEGMAPRDKPKGKPKSRNRRHGRRR
jgi:SecD/SecF fusion protein